MPKLTFIANSIRNVHILIYFYKGVCQNCVFKCFASSPKMDEVFTRLNAKYSLEEVKKIVNVETTNQVSTGNSCSNSDSPYNIITKDNFYNINSQLKLTNVTFSFLNSKLMIKSYAIESTTDPYGCNWAYPISWHLDGSNDKNHWSPIHTVSNNYSLTNKGKLIWFDLPKIVVFPYYRFVSTATNDNGLWLGISEIEFRGFFESEIRGYKVVCRNSKCNRNGLKQSLVYLIVVCVDGK